MESQLITMTKPASSGSPTAVFARPAILQRKCACGAPAASLTSACPDCQSKKLLQPKLTIGASNDPLEQEADRVADQAMALPAHSNVTGTPPRIQRFAGQATGDAGLAPASVDQALASSGSPLEPALRQDMEQRFGHDFSQVRVHANPAAEQSAREVGAHAYTVGHDIVIGAGKYTPGTIEGRRLLAHEMTHVVQQTGGTAPSPVCAPVLQRKGGYPKTVTIENAEVSVASKVEEDEARQIVAEIKRRFGISFDPQKGLQALKNSVVGDPEQPPTFDEALRNPGAPKKKVKDLLDTSIWTVSQLRDLQTGLAFFAPVLGASRSAANLDPTTQRLTSVSRLNVGLDDSNTATDKNIYGQFFSSENHAAFFDAAGSATELADKKKSFLGTVVHEVAHAMLGGNKALFVSGPSPAFWKDEKTPTNDPKAEAPVTAYGGKNAGEDLAEAVKFYFVEPATLQQKCPQRYAIIDKLVQRWRPKGPSTKP